MSEIPRIMAFKGIKSTEYKDHFKEGKTEFVFSSKGINSLDIYKTFLAENCEVVKSDLDRATFQRDGDYLSIRVNTANSIQQPWYNYNRTKLFTDGNFDPLWTIRLYDIPKKIAFKSKHYNPSGYNGEYYFWWALEFVGETTGTRYFPVLAIDLVDSTAYSEWNGVFINNGLTQLQKFMSSGWLYEDISIDIASQCPDCFTTKEESYLVSQYSARWYYESGAGKTYNIASFWVSDLVIK